MAPSLPAVPPGALPLPLFASARATPRAPRSAGTLRLCRAGAATTSHHCIALCLPAPSASVKLRAASAAVVLFPAAAAVAAPLDSAAVETVQQVSAVLNVAAAPLALVFSAVLFLFASLKGDLAKLEKDLGKKTDDLKGDLGKKTDDLGKKTDDLKGSQTLVLSVLSLLTLLSAYSALAAPK